VNYKTIGDRGQNCAIGELAKFGLGVAFPLSDNYPFDLIVIAGEKLFRMQVKSSSLHTAGTVAFKLTTNNFYRGDTKNYTTKDCDVLGCYDLRRHQLYLLDPSTFEGRRSFNIRFSSAKNDCGTSNSHDDFVISAKRVKEVFEFETPSYDLFHAQSSEIRHECLCLMCGDKFKSAYKKSKYCSTKCRGEADRRVVRPSKEELAALVRETPMTHVGQMFGVSDNSVRKWCRAYGISLDGENRSATICVDEPVTQLAE
jgi:hypothetical protein